MQLMKVGENLGHIIKGVRPLRMTSNLRHLPRCELAVNVFGELLTLLMQLVDLFADIDCRVFLHEAQLFDFGFQFSDRLLKAEKGGFAHASSLSSWQWRSACDRPACRIIAILCCQYQYSTGKGSSDRQRYQVATVRQGSQLAATSRASLRETGSPEK